MGLGAWQCSAPFPFWARRPRASDICAALTEAEVSAAVGTPLKRSPTDACRFGSGRNSVYLTMHAGGGSQYETYASQARRDFPDAQLVPGVPARYARF